MKHSHSKAEAYKKCPYSWKKQVIDKIPIPPNMYMSRGSFVHAVLEYFHRDLKPETKSFAFAMGKAYRTIRDEYHKEDKILFKLEDVKIILQDYINYLHKEGRPDIVRDAKGELMLERKFEVAIAGRQFRGIIDRIDKVGDNEYLIVDYKTSKGNSYLAKSLQPYIYYYGGKDLLGREAKLSFGYLLLGIPKMQRKEVTEEELKIKTEELRYLIAAIETDTTFKRKRSRACPYCGYYNDDCKEFFNKII